MNNAELMASLYAAFGSGDVPTVLGAMHPEITWHEAEGNPYSPKGEPFVGPDGILNNLFAKLGEDWDGFAVNPTKYHDAGDVVTVEGRYTGKNKATGTSMDSQFCHIWTFTDGKIKNFQQYTDTSQLQNAMGAKVG